MDSLRKWIACLLLSASIALAAKATSPLDQVAVKLAYSEGDFEPAIAMLEEFQKSHADFTREESLMVYKYLGVMYSADQETREKGKNYFYKLLRIDPEAKILDLYVSIVVQDIFKNTLDELMGQKDLAMEPRPQKDAASGAGKQDVAAKRGDQAVPPRSGKPPVLKAEKSHAIYWWTGGLALVAGAATGYYLYNGAADAGPDTEIPVKF